MFSLASDSIINQLLFLVVNLLMLNSTDLANVSFKVKSYSLFEHFHYLASINCFNLFACVFYRRSLVCSNYINFFQKFEHFLTDTWHVYLRKCLYLFSPFLFLAQVVYLLTPNGLPTLTWSLLPQTTQHLMVVSLSLHLHLCCVHYIFHLLCFREIYVFYHKMDSRSYFKSLGRW